MVGEEKKRVMDDFGNIIYVLAAIGWFFWNAYKKSQQGKEKNSPKPQGHSTSHPTEVLEDEPSRSLEDMILEQLGGKKEEPKPVTVETASKLPPQHRNQDKFLKTDLDHSHLADDYKMSEGESGSHRVERQVRRLKVKEVEKEESLMDNLFPDEGFDLRKAVVLSAILDRPYK